MKLNADILYERLGGTFAVTAHGLRRKKPSLGRPELYGGGNQFAGDRVYAADVRELPEDPEFAGRPVLVLTGGEPPAAYTSGKCVSLVVTDGAGLAPVFNALQAIYNRLDTWAEELEAIVNTTASIGSMVELSFPILENPMEVIDANFHFLAYSRIIDEEETLAAYRPNASGDVDVDSFSQSVNTNMNLDVRNPFFTGDENGTRHLCVNLQERGSFNGTLTVHFLFRPDRPGDVVLAQYLAHAMERALLRCATPVSSPSLLALHIFRDLLNGILPKAETQTNLLAIRGHKAFLCAKIVQGDRIRKKVPTEYICEQIENTFSGSYAFSYESAVFTLFDLRECGCTEEEFLRRFSQLLGKLEMKAGLSNVFSDLLLLQQYYREAAAVIETGYMLHPEEACYRFQDMVLPYMIRGCCGEFSHEMLYMPGFEKLLEHDAGTQSRAKYVETLRCYLNNNMNAVQTSLMLGIHRSTLLERLSSIRELLPADLEDPDQRLRLQISLKLLEYSGEGSRPLNAWDGQSGKGEVPIQMVNFDA